MNLDDEVPILFGRLGKCPVAQDAGIADQDVDSAESFDRGSEDIVFPGWGGVVAIGHSAPADRYDLSNHFLSGGRLHRGHSLCFRGR